ncbi:hypothetical protein SAMN05444671_3486 [Flavobacterium sp. CF108]|uniref:DUF5683 domain-containing protein n=1 Tax=Flavobacterium panici TaxID=2654843 RepID=A0A9N8J5A3_9FLAO|nr:MULTISPECIES: DUF5683 domain-containing protein [Flavobacterium]KOP37808.1 hypothetical protein AKO67_13070 [Flavobacterium sp. VMW]MDR6762639.1 hypothetical protein [Flavobacterium sp. 2755]OWU90961.1 hypothetical protein APR43_10830 [Flavobacterium sp. NLM]PUU70025.1 hypothetical protein DBB36_10755 [Flavobacterium sp. WLB]UUF14756.1 DUF5683 domain-containing protein [Flavobacterium panici]
MNKIVPISLLFFLIGTVSLFAQVKKDTVLVVKDTTALIEIDPLTPAKAAFYSAILPGLGQVYNKKYWKVPLVYGAIGTSLYFYIDNNKKYHDYRDAYKRRLEGYNDDKYQFLDESRLIAGQKFYQRNRDLSALFVVGFYVLNIIDANVDAALIQFNVNERLSLRPEIYPADVTFKPNVGLTFNYRF